MTRGANQLASGLALGFFGIGLSAFVGRPYVGQLIDGLPELPIPGLADLPGLGRVFFDHDLLTYAVVPIALLIAWALMHTRWGLSLRAVGENKTVAYAAGLRPELAAISGDRAGGDVGWAGRGASFAGLYRGLARADDCGRGFIAVALVIFAQWNPIRAVWGALLFGGALAFQLQLQARGAPISPFFLDMLPYLLTLAVLLTVGTIAAQCHAGGVEGCV